MAAALPDALSLGFDLVDPFPGAWPRRGLPGSLPGGREARVVRTDPYEDGTDGFFVAVFERQLRPHGGGEEGGGGGGGQEEGRAAGAAAAEGEARRQRRQHGERKKGRPREGGGGEVEAAAAGKAKRKKSKVAALVV